jgi:phosphoglycerate dehydrogenase-like enzyme
MDRRTFISSAAAAASLGTLGEAQAQKKLKVLIPAMTPEQLAELRAAAPNVELVVCKDGAEVLANAADAEGSYGFVSADLLKAAKKLRWIQIGSAGVEGVVTIPGLAESDITLTNMQRIYAPEIADQALGYLLAFTRSLPTFIAQGKHEDLTRPPDVVLEELEGKSMLVIALGGIGSHIARRAHAFGMRIVATDPKVTDKPAYVAELHKPDAFHRLLPQADVVASAVPLTPVTRKMVGEREFGMMKKGVIFINVSRGGVADTEALVRALASGHVAAAGLDVTDPEPLPKGHALWKQNIILTPHTAGTSPGGFKRAFNLFKENLRRFSGGQTLLNIVDKKAGY